MIYAEILAGGVGSRMGNIKMPKQFLMLGSKPIIIHTIEKFMIQSQFEKIFIIAHKNWVDHTQNIITKYIGIDERLVVLPGGDERSDSLMVGPRYLQKNNLLTVDDIIVTHDSVRPFITRRIIDENIEECLKFGAVDTVIDATDTIVVSNGGDYITEIPDRDRMYQGQTPQSFNVTKLVKLQNNLDDEQKKVLTDGCKIFVISNETVKMVKGGDFNIKITTPFDLKLANSMIEREFKND